MPSRIYRSLFLTVLALRALSSESAPHISPASGSDALLAVRSDTQAELRLQYRVERDSAPPETVTVGLAKDYHYKSSAVGLWMF